MQLVPGTAKETAKWIRLKKFRIPESLFDPETNIRMGTHYLRRMLKKYKGIVPLAMAAYNVGPGIWTAGYDKEQILKTGRNLVPTPWMICGWMSCLGAKRAFMAKPRCEIFFFTRSSMAVTKP